ncbi:MAG: hypothetical protein Q4G00_15055, partial [Clostridia bacterium]|nr:hypothetical protein [Clostridia bacterium]
RGLQSRSLTLYPTELRAHTSYPSGKLDYYSMVFFLCQAVPLPFSHIFNHGFPTESVMEKHETKKSKEKDDKGS